MKKSMVYLRAAKIMNSEQAMGCCGVLSYFCDSNFGGRCTCATMIEPLEALFKPPGQSHWQYWWKEPPQDQKERVLAFLFMHWIQKDAELREGRGRKP